MIERHRLFSMGIGYTDSHLLASVLLDRGAVLWTRDKHLSGAAEKSRRGATRANRSGQLRLPEMTARLRPQPIGKEARAALSVVDIGGGHEHGKAPLSRGFAGGPS